MNKNELIDIIAMKRPQFPKSKGVFKTAILGNVELENIKLYNEFRFKMKQLSRNQRRELGNIIFNDFSGNYILDCARHNHFLRYRIREINYYFF